MATKNNPGAFDCFANAKPDEPIFILLARDELAPWVVAIWAAARDKNQAAFYDAAASLFRAADKKDPADPLKISEANGCALSMMGWKTENPDV